MSDEDIFRTEAGHEAEDVVHTLCALAVGGGLEGLVEEQEGMRGKFVYYPCDLLCFLIEASCGVAGEEFLLG